MKNIWKAAVMLTLSALLLAAVWLAGLLAFSYFTLIDGEAASPTLADVSAALAYDAGSYSLADDGPALPDGHWLMLIDGGGDVVWSRALPDDVPRHYTLSDVAAFSRWYLGDYPVRTLIRPDGLLVMGAPKGSLWKYNISAGLRLLRRLPFFFAALGLASLGGTLAVSALLSRHWFRKEQARIDAARSGWINGVSHDIRTPLSVVMGYAGQMEGDAALPAPYRERAAVIRRQSQTIRDLVNDLNLTMRLDCAMQPLRCEWVAPSALLRQITADFINGGLAAGHSVALELPPLPLPQLWADPFLLRRAIGNLLSNCVVHAPPDCHIRLGAQAQGDALAIWVESGGASAAPPVDAPRAPLEEDGGAAHGTGLRLVRQIAAAHGGTAEFFPGDSFRCELRLPLSPRGKGGAHRGRG